MSHPGFDGGLEARMMSWQKRDPLDRWPDRRSPDELVQRGIRLALESERSIAHIAADLGMHPETLRKKVRQHEADIGFRCIARAGCSHATTASAAARSTRSL